MKDIKELEGMTFWDITTNEGALTQLVLGTAMIALSVMYLVMSTYYKIYFKIRR